MTDFFSPVKIATMFTTSTCAHLSAYSLFTFGCAHEYTAIFIVENISLDDVERDEGIGQPRATTPHHLTHIPCYKYLCVIYPQMLNILKSFTPIRNTSCWDKPF